MVHLEDGRKIIGWPYLYSDEPERRQLCLKEALVKEADGSQYEVAGPWVLITEVSKITLIEFLN